MLKNVAFKEKRLTEKEKRTHVQNYMGGLKTYML